MPSSEYENKSLDLSLLRLVSTITQTADCAILFSDKNGTPRDSITHPQAAHDFCSLIIDYAASHRTLSQQPGVVILPITAATTEHVVIRFAPPQNLTPSMAAMLNDLKSVVHFPQRRRQATIPGRVESYQALTQQIDIIARQPRKSQFGTILFAVDQLRQINQHYGWDTADQALNTLTDKVKASLPPQSFFGNFGGGQFIIITPPGTSSTGTQHLLHELQKLTATPITIDNHSISFTLSIGWGLFPKDGRTTEELILATTAALTTAQQTGGSHDIRATEEQTERHHAAQTLEQDLSNAITNDALFLRWMPIVDLQTHKIIGQEALLRWNRPHFGEVSPILFIENAEKNGLIEQLDQWVLREACRVASSWQQPWRVCVNISPIWLTNERLADLVHNVLQTTDLAPHRLQVELSERTPFTPENVIHREISRARALGIRIAIDDFGSGTSSLEHLRTYPIDQLKLDRVFVDRLYEDDRADNVMRCILRMAQTLGLSVCAKGVETERQLSFLDSHGCLEAQGFLFGPPELLSTEA